MKYRFELDFELDFRRRSHEVSVNELPNIQNNYLCIYDTDNIETSKLYHSALDLMNLAKHIGHKRHDTIKFYIVLGKNKHYYLKIVSEKGLDEIILKAPIIIDHSNKQEIIKYIPKEIIKEIIVEKEVFVETNKNDKSKPDECGICMDASINHALSCGHMLYGYCVKLINKCLFCQQIPVNII